MVISMNNKKQQNLKIEKTPISKEKMTLLKKMINDGVNKKMMVKYTDLSETVISRYMRYYTYSSKDNKRQGLTLTNE